MRPSQPPLRRGRSYNAAGQKLNKAYDAWVAHWYKCATCTAQDWYLPNEQALCGEGLVLFDAWGKAALLDTLARRDQGAADQQLKANYKFTRRRHENRY